MGMHSEIEIEKELSPQAIDKYKRHRTQHIFPPERLDVRELFGDGHEKVLMKSAGR